MRIILIRHGQTEWNQKEVFRGHADMPLDNTGRDQARAVAEGISPFDIQRIYSSPLQRAIETARIIGAKFGIEPCTDRGLIDMDFGVWEGLPLETVQKDYPDLYKVWLREPQNLQLPDGESLEAVRQRLNRFLDGIMSGPHDHDIAIVSHRVILKVLICIMLTLDNSFFWRIKQDLGAVSVFDCAQGTLNLVLLNDVCHLKTTGASRKDF